MAEYIVRMEPEHPEFQVLIGALLRCRDCKHHRTNDQGMMFCPKHHHLAEPDGFCAWGEPREP